MNPEATARFLHDARRTRRPIDPLPDAIRPRTEREGYAAQRALAGDVVPRGFKIGATALAMRAWLGLDQPMAGFLEPDAIHASGASVPFASMLRAGVECEIALRLGRDLPWSAEPPDLDEIDRAVDAWFPTIELVDDRYAQNAAAMGAPTIIADQVFHAGAVLGADAPPGADLPDLTGELRVDGTLRGQGRGADLMDDPRRVVAWLAASPAAELFGGLRAGQVVLCGSVCAPVWLDGPCLVEVSFGSFGSVSVRFT